MSISNIQYEELEQLLIEVVGLGELLNANRLAINELSGKQIRSLQQWFENSSIHVDRAKVVHQAHDNIKQRMLGDE